MCEIIADDELDQLFKNIELDEPDSGNDDNNNNNNNNKTFQVVLFATVRSPTVEPQGRGSLALTEGSHRVGRPSLSPVTKEILK